MAWFAKTPPRGIAIPTLIMAAHEAGHALVFHESGVRVVDCTIHPEDEWGLTNVEDPADDQLHGFLIGIAAGAAGEKQWCETYGQKLPRHWRNGRSYGADLADFHTFRRRHRETRGLGFHKAERLARVILRDNAKRFRALTEQLARDGELKI